MKKSGFSMIELVFVIVVLGILAAVALPRLTATRTDAEYVKALNDLETLIRDIQNYYYSKGAENMPTLGRTNKNDIYLDLKQMTNVPLDYTNPAEPDYYIGSKPCYKVDVVRLDRGGEFAAVVNRDIIAMILKPSFRDIKPACEMLRKHQLFRQYDWNHAVLFK
ncbi:MAG: type II secretion system protein, partial [Campylobacter sp.]|nr:type II secretion system protein [Campylobacter sp.]